MTDTLRDRIAKLLHEETWFRLPERESGELADAILAIPGIAVVELPEPSEFADMWLHGDVHVASPSTHPGTPVALEIDPGSPVYFTVEYARDLAAALLAAADYAERDQ